MIIPPTRSRKGLKDQQAFFRHRDYMQTMDLSEYLRGVKPAAPLPERPQRGGLIRCVAGAASSAARTVATTIMADDALRGQVIGWALRRAPRG